MIDLDPQQAAARHWFESLRDRICAEFEAIEREAGSKAAFEYTSWNRADPSGVPGGGGVMGVMKGRVFEKVGVNVSTVGGTFEGDFAKSIHGAGEDPRFFATGISLVAHMTNPHVPAVHMNCRFLNTTKRWFGGGGDLNPPLSIEEDTADFHATMKALPAVQGVGRDLFLHPAPEGQPRRRRHLLRSSGRRFRDQLRLHAGRWRGVSRCVSADRATADEYAVRCCRRSADARMAGALCGVQPGVRPRHAVRAEDGRQHRRDPDEPAAARDVVLIRWH
jgi:hypothetical protein